MEADQNILRGGANSGKDGVVLFRCMPVVYLRRYNVQVMGDQTQS